MNILITGGAGYLGSVITPLLVNKGYDVTVYDNLMYNQLTLSDLCYKSNFKFVYGDVRDYKKLNEYVQKADVIIPLAAIVGFPACEKDKQLAEEVNYNQIYDLITNTSKEQTIIFPNTNSGYGTRSSGICKENQKLQPISHYGITKCNAEDILLQNGNAIIIRFATVFGVSPRMRLDLLVNEFVYKALTDKYITIFERKAVRNYIHIRDVASVFEWMVVLRDIHRGEIFNVGLSDTNINKKELVERIQRQIPNTSITYSDYFEDPDKRNYVVSNEKIESTGWKPQYSLDDGITELIQAYKMIVPQESSRYRNAFPLSYGQSI